MQADGLEWDEDYRPFARAALTEVIEDQMALAVESPAAVGRVLGLEPLEINGLPLMIPAHCLPEKSQTPGMAGLTIGACIG
jgi:hypothetical protein